ncbi:DUF4132 domain-containing protein [Massilia atriviolacea]|uniref:DUF4132 domain-containing protein n=1 Tax=Massilia atriviolacea TaxID=2495579 RepID=A0A430HTM4_9BURK|nr:DUF4132 domain-containing protein [Massilia atriviolacea]RSZ60923.1 DUF4132 domain-containing protein [Massilia atriviolacea]
MNDQTPPPSSLAALSALPNKQAALAAAIDERLQNGHLQEVLDFLGSCDIELVRHIDPYIYAPIWKRDPALWRTLARTTAPRGFLWRAPDPEIMPGDASFSHELRAIADRHLADAATVPGNEARYFVLHSVVHTLPYPGIGRDEVLELVDWTLSLRRAAGIRDDAEASCGLPQLLACLPDTADLIALAGQAKRLCEFALREHGSRLREGEARQHWLPWHAFFQAHPGYLDTFHEVVGDPALIVGRWPHASPELRDELRNTVVRKLRYDMGADEDYLVEALDWIIRADEAGFADFLSAKSYVFNERLASLIWKERYPLLLPQLFPRIFGRNECVESHADTLRAMLAAQPELMLTVPAASLDRVLVLLPAATLRAGLPVLTTVIGGSSSKSLRAAMAEAAKRLDIADLVGAGWLAVRSKNLRLACKDILLAHPDQDGAAPLLARMLAAGALDAASASTVSAAVAQRAPAAAPAAPVLACDEDRARLEAEAAGIKRWSAAIKPLDHPETLALFQPLSEHAARATLQLAATGEEGLPPLAVDLLVQVPPENRARLARQAMETWIASNGEPKLRWMLRLAQGAADDRSVDLLSAAVFAWGKTRKQRAVIAIDQLAALDSLYALARVLEIAESRKIKPMVVEAALAALHAAAARRQLGIGELLDELTPDFGLGDGVALSVGAQHYQVALQGDLSLRLVDARGKLSKTLPAVRDDSLKPAWEAANSRFKTLGAALKTVAKQLTPRMLVALVTGKRWSAQRWTRLFRDHALLKILGRSLIWQSQGTAPASFRIAEDLSLVQADDSVFSLPDDAMVTLWHPASAAAGELDAWRAHLADYELTPLIDQLNAPSALPPAASMNAERLLAPAGLRVAQEQLASIMNKCGYRQGPTGDGAWITWHAWPLAAAQLEVRLQNGIMSPYMNIGSPIDIDSIEVWSTDGRQALVAPAGLPVPLLATLWAQLQLLDTKRMAEAIEGAQ